MKRLLLVGGGQAHAFVLRALAANPRHDVEVVLVTPSDRLVYSGMLPGWIAGHYTLPELTIPLAPLAEAARAVLVQRRIVGLDLEHKVVRTDRNELIEFDLLLDRDRARRSTSTRSRARATSRCRSVRSTTSSRAGRASMRTR